jgi:hypothetical protein
MLIDGNLVCDKCGSSEQPEPVHDGFWDYCFRCKTNYDGYREGRRDRALDALGHAVDGLLEEEMTHVEIRKAVQVRLQAYGKEEQEQLLGDAFREAK